MWIKVNDTTLEVIATCINEISIEAGFTVYEIDNDDMPDDLINPSYGFAQYQFIADGYGSGTFLEYTPSVIADMEEACDNENCDIEKYIPASGSVSGRWKGVSVPTGGQGQISFMLPTDFSHLHSLNLIGFPDATKTGKNIRLYSDYGGIGQAHYATQEESLAGSFDFVNDVFFEIDLKVVFSNVVAGDMCSIHIVHNTIDATILYTGIQMIYHRS